jgi:hypothetical protein
MLSNSRPIRPSGEAVAGLGREAKAAFASPKKQLFDNDPEIGGRSDAFVKLI